MYPRLDCCVVLADRVNSTLILAFAIELSETDAEALG
jgi:hypothetical protein